MLTLPSTMKLHPIPLRNKVNPSWNHSESHVSANHTACVDQFLSSQAAKARQAKLKFHSNTIIRLQPSKCASLPSEEMTINH